MELLCRWEGEGASLWMHIRANFVKVALRTPRLRNLLCPAEEPVPLTIHDSNFPWLHTNAEIWPENHKSASCKYEVAIRNEF